MIQPLLLQKIGGVEKDQSDRVQLEPQAILSLIAVVDM